MCRNQKAENCKQSILFQFAADPDKPPYPSIMGEILSIDKYEKFC